MRQRWFGSADWPLQGDGEWPGTFPRGATSESGLRFVLDLDRGDERCREVKPDFWDRQLICMMPKGHDTPHMPMTRELEADAGPMMVRSIMSPRPKAAAREER